mgnify:FL=1
MKYPKAKKLPSGKWHCRVRVQGRDVSITRQTKDEAVAEAMAVKAGIRQGVMNEPARRRSLTVYQAMDEYIDARQNVLSPSTIRGYRIIQKHRFQKYRNYRIGDISVAKWQKIVNEEARLCSAKTLKNAWGFMASVIYDTVEQKVTVRLPQIAGKEKPFLTAEQIPVFVEALKGKPFEIPALLALSSLRRSEIWALDWEDFNLQNGTIRIAGAVVLDEENALKRKETNKNQSSARVVPIIPPLFAALDRVDKTLRHGSITQQAPDTVFRGINHMCATIGVPEVGFHGLRRSFASLAYHLGLSEEVTMRIGGWSNIYTMRKIYTKISDRDINDQVVRLQAFFSDENARSDNENDNKKA